VKVTYPAKILGSEIENNFGIFPVDGEKAPFLIVNFINDFDCGAEIYQ
jgi:hypothetical protein